MLRKGRSAGHARELVRWGREKAADGGRQTRLAGLCQWRGSVGEPEAGTVRSRLGLERVEAPEHAEEEGRVDVHGDLVVAVGDKIQRPRLEELVYVDVSVELETSSDLGVVNLQRARAGVSLAALLSL